MSISSSVSQETLNIQVEGRFDFSALQAFRDTYEKLQPVPKRYVIDLAKADYLDSSALGMLLALRDHAGGDNADITIKNAIPDVRKILVITKLDELFNLE